LLALVTKQSLQGRRVASICGHHRVAALRAPAEQPRPNLRSYAACINALASHHHRRARIRLRRIDVVAGDFARGILRERIAWKHLRVVEM
jgi:hypothetical protein